MDAYRISTIISRLGLGSKINYLFYFSIRFIQISQNDIHKLKKTLKSRGFKHKTSLFVYQTYANLIAMLVLRSVRKSQIL